MFIIKLYNIIYTNIGYVYMLTALAVLSPSGVVPVCVGERLDLVCTSTGLTNNDFIDWNITVPSMKVFGSHSMSDTRLISAAGQASISPIVLNMIIFIFNLTRTVNVDNSITLKSVMSVANVTGVLNGSRVFCSEIRHPAPNSVPSMTSSIHVINYDYGKYFLFHADSVITIQ